jgi:hypothetical protein
MDHPDSGVYHNYQTHIERYGYRRNYRVTTAVSLPNNPLAGVAVAVALTPASSSSQSNLYTEGTLQVMRPYFLLLRIIMDGIKE